MVSRRMESGGEKSMKIKTNTPLSDTEVFMVTRILKESKCPHESLRATFPNEYHHKTDTEIYFGNPPWDLTQEIIV